MPGDCSPSRRVVSKMMTRSLMVLLSVGFSWVLLQLGSRLRGRHALFPPKGEEKKEGGEAEASHVRCAAYQRLTWMPRALGAAQTARVSGSGRRPSASMRSLRRKAARTTVPPTQANGSGGTGGGSP